MKSVNKRRITILSALAALLFSTVSVASENTVNVTWTKEGVDWKQYNQVYLKPLDLSEIRIVRPPWAEDDPKDWNFEATNPDMVQAVFRDTVKDSLEGNDGYKVVHGPGEGILEVEAEILSVMPYVRPGGGEEDGYQLLTLGSGEMTTRVELRDSRSRELLLLAEGDTIVGSEYKENNQANNLANLVEKFAGFGERLRKALDQAHGK